MTETPNSERTVYFDAPLAHSSMSDSTEHTDTLLNAASQPASTQQDNTRANPSVEQNQHSHDVNAKKEDGWLPAIDQPTTEPERRRSVFKPGGNNGVTGVAPSDHPEEAVANRTQEAPDVKRSTSPARTGSLSRRSIFTGTECRPTSPFIHGAGTTVTAPPNEELSARVADADAHLTSGQKARINRLEAKEAKRLSRIIKEEGKVEKKALDVVLDELAELQNLQKKVVKEEAKAHGVYAKLLELVRKNETEALEAKARHDITLAQLRTEEELLEKIKESARGATEQMRAKTQELENLRAVFSVDEREREVRLMQLTGKKSSFWR